MLSAPNNTELSFSRQLSFDFGIAEVKNITPEEQALLDITSELDYSKFNRNMHRDTKVSPRQMIVLFLYGCMHQKTSSRDLKWLTERDVFIRAVIGETTEISHSTIARFKHDNTEAFEDLFYQFVNKLGDMGELTKDTIYQDGTKIEARSNKYTFIWKSFLLKMIDSRIGRLRKHAETAVELNFLPSDLKSEDLTDQELIVQMTFVLEEIRSLNLPVPEKRGRGHRVDKRFKLMEQLDEELSTVGIYEEELALIGDDRNSMSKTDPDATFMHLKEDAMMNGQTKPAYNNQIAADSRYIVATVTTCDRTDYNTVEPVFDKIDRFLNWDYHNFTADSGYDCLSNFKYLEKRNVQAFIKPQNWEMRKKKSFGKDIGHYQNMQYDEENDEFICKNGKKLTFDKSRKNKYGDAEPYREYSCKEGCIGCPFHDKCIKHARRKAEPDEMKRFSVALEHWKYRSKAFDLLTTDEGARQRVNRSIQAEGVFAQIKGNNDFRRYDTFGFDGTFTEWLIQCFTYNLRWLAKRRYGSEETPQFPFLYELQLTA